MVCRCWSRGRPRNRTWESLTEVYGGADRRRLPREVWRGPARSHPPEPVSRRGRIRSGRRGVRGRAQVVVLAGMVGRRRGTGSRPAGTRGDRGRGGGRPGSQQPRFPGPALGRGCHWRCAPASPWQQRPARAGDAGAAQPGARCGGARRAGDAGTGGVGRRGSGNGLAPAGTAQRGPRPHRGVRRRQGEARPGTSG